ncbi:MAG: FtsX-like permease family protein [Candidatus Eisenbacteria bacterium]|nr:FtsX-like permease family protein [Candidatus Eisenbacteria bacterium]
MRAFLFFAGEGVSQLRRSPAASVAAVTAVGAVLFVLLLLMLLSQNILALSERLRERKGLSVFLDPQLDQTQVSALRERFAGFGEIAEVRLVTRDEALRGIEEELGSPGLAEVVGENPLPDVLLVTPAPHAADARELDVLAREFEAYPGVDDVLYGERWVRALDHGLGVVRRANALTGGLATLAIVLVLGNTLRLLVLMREEQLAIMKVIGATDAFVRAPFVMAGILLCLIGGLVALGFLRVGFEVSRSLMPGLQFLSLPMLLLYLGGVALVGLLGSLVTVEVSIRQLERRGGMLQL